MSGMIASLLAHRTGASEDDVERVLELSVEFAAAGEAILEAAGRLTLLYECELLPDPRTDLDKARRRMAEAQEALRRYDLSRTIAKGRAAMAGGQEAISDPAKRTEFNGIDEDDLTEALDDAVTDGEGHITPYYLHRHLARHGMKVVPIAADPGEFPDGDA